MDMSKDEKLDIIEKEYEIPLEDDIREEVSVMCNLSQGIREKGREEGREEGRNQRDKEKIADMLKDGKSPQAIADFCDYPLKLVQEVQQSMLITQ